MINQPTEKQERGEYRIVQQFMSAIQDDARVTPYHVSLFAAIVHYKQSHGCGEKMYAFSYDLMPLAKISSCTTYHKCIKDLHDFGYINYEPTYDRFLGSKIVLAIQ